MNRVCGVRARTILVAGIVPAAVLLSLLVGSSAGAGSRTCLDRKATIVGTSDSDVIYGTNGSDVVVGRGGQDQIHGLGGDDFIYGGSAGNGSPAENDQADGGEGSDLCQGVEQATNCET